MIPFDLSAAVLCWLAQVLMLLLHRTAIYGSIVASVIPFDGINLRFAFSLQTALIL